MKNRKDKTTLALARFACELVPDKIPLSAYDAAKKCILDIVAASAAGSRSLAAMAVLDMSERLFSSGRSDVWFSGKTFNAPGAAYVNSTFASALDLDDGHREAMGHPGASIIPAALAVAQETNAAGRELLAAIIIGYEVAIRVAAARDHAAQDTLATGRWCVYGATAAGGRLRHMPAKKLAEAFAVAGVHAPGLSAAGYSQVMGNSAKEGIPWATLTGLSALWLADKGFTGPTDILDHADYYDSNKIISGLGNSFAVEKVYFKVHTFERALRLNNYPVPNSLEDAQYSIPFCMAVAAIEGKEGLLPLTPTLLSRKDIVSFAHKIQLYSDQKLDRLFPAMVPARVIAHTKKGAFEKVVKSPKGDLSNPMNFSEIENKLRRLSRQNRPGTFPGKILDVVNSLENSGIYALTSVLKK
jgi:2-methylcitrate dehydratase PrpD